MAAWRRGNRSRPSRLLSGAVSLRIEDGQVIVGSALYAVSVEESIESALLALLKFPAMPVNVRAGDVDEIREQVTFMLGYNLAVGRNLHAAQVDRTYCVNNWQRQGWDEAAATKSQVEFAESFREFIQAVADRRAVEPGYWPEENEE